MAFSLYRRLFILILVVLVDFAAIQAQDAGQKKAATGSVNPVANNRVENEDAFFEDLFRQYPGKFDSVLKYRNKYNVQIIYTEIDRGANGIPALKHYYFNRRNARYFYPASTIKLPVALLTLQKLNEMKGKGVGISNTMITEAAYNGQTPVYNDPNTANGKPSIAQYIKKLFLVSDNDAFNRLYEFSGQEYINNQLEQKGYKEAQVLHRLGIFLNEDENRHTNPVNFYDSSNRLLYSQPMQFNTRQYSRRTDTIGNAYYSNDVLINKPMIFSGKNRISLDDLHSMLIGLVFPEKVKSMQRFNITEDDRMFVLKCMSQYPGESKYPYYDSSEYPQAFTKFLYAGAEHEPIPPNIRIFNKSGEGYGQLTDVAYIIDTDKKIEFLVSASIYCNEDGILNDDAYDYETIGYPFLKQLGRALYDRELSRKRNIIPDLSVFMFSYDK